MSAPFCLILCCSLLFAGCASAPERFTPVALGGNQAVRPGAGDEPYVLSKARFSSVAITRLKNAESDSYGVTFSVKVQSDLPIQFGPANIRVVQAGQSRPVLGHMEVRKENAAKRANAEGMSILAAVLGGANAALDRGNAAYHLQSSRFLIEANNAEARNTRAFDSVAQLSHWSERQLRAGIPSDGLISVKDVSGTPLEFFVRVGSDTHQLRFQPAK